MNNSALVNKALEDLLDPSVKLGDALLKVKAIAFIIGNEKLKTFARLERGGYAASGVEMPKYRCVPTKLQATLITKFGHQQNNKTLPIEYLGDEDFDLYSKQYLPQSVSELEHLVKGSKVLSIDLPAPLAHDIQKRLYSGTPWQIYHAWQAISVSSVEGVLAAIREQALEVVLEIKSEYGDELPLDSLKNKKEVNELVNKSLQSITVESGGVLNLANGDASIQATNTGQGAINAATGSNISQSISGEQSTSLKELIKEIEQIIASESTFKNQREEMSEELKRVDVQLKREEPKKGIIKRSFESLKDLAADAAGATAGHAVFELIKQGLELSQ